MSSSKKKMKRKLRTNLTQKETEKIVASLLEKFQQVGGLNIVVNVIGSSNQENQAMRDKVTDNSTGNSVSKAMGSRAVASTSIGHDDQGVRDFLRLSTTLADSGVESVDIELLRLAIEKDPAPDETGKFGKNVGNWIGNMVGKAASGAWDVSTGSAGALLAMTIGQYYGLPV